MVPAILLSTTVSSVRVVLSPLLCYVTIFDPLIVLNFFSPLEDPPIREVHYSEWLFARGLESNRCFTLVLLVYQVPRNPRLGQQTLSKARLFLGLLSLTLTFSLFAAYSYSLFRWYVLDICRFMYKTMLHYTI